MVAPAQNRGKPVLPDERDVPLARESSRRLARFGSEPLTVRIAGSNEPVTLPARAVRLLVDLLSQMARGNAVTIVPYDAELTTQQAADLLGVSRPFLVKQLETGRLPFRKVGTHRRIGFADLAAYKQSMYKKRRKTLQGLAALDQELELE